MRKLLLSSIATAVIAAGAAILGPTPAHADFISTLNFTNDSGLGSGPFGTVNIALNSSTSATATFTADAGYYFIDSHIADLQVNASSFTVSNYTATAAPGSTGTASDLLPGMAGNVDSLGTFNLVTNDHGGTGQALTTVDFDITNTSGTWASAADVLTTNSGGYDAAAHVVVCSGSVTGCGTNNTGYVGEIPSTSPVPEPASLALLGSGLLGLGLVRRRRRKA